MADGPEAVLDNSDSGVSSNLWLYTNFDCNLRCSYCVTKSTPKAPRRPLALTVVRRLVDEAVALGFSDIFFTGGEPFMIDQIYAMLAYASARMRTTVLTNAMLLNGERLDRLSAIASDDLRVQVSLDGGRPEEHDAYRGKGTWARTVTRIKQLLQRDIRVCISSTETPANSPHLDELHGFRRGLGIPDEDHLVRPLARRGFSCEGVDVGRENLEPEITVTAEGVFWHPLTFPGDVEMKVSGRILPLVDAIDSVARELVGEGRPTPRTQFT